MKIAIPLRENNQVDDHFGHCRHFGVFTLSDSGQVTERLLIPSVEGCGCKSNIASTLASAGVKVMLAGGIGDSAIKRLSQSGIRVVRGCSGDAGRLLSHFAAGTLEDSGSSCHQHGVPGGEDHGHSCAAS